MEFDLETRGTDPSDNVTNKIIHRKTWKSNAKVFNFSNWKSPHSLHFHSSQRFYFHLWVSFWMVIHNGNWCFVRVFMDKENPMWIKWLKFNNYIFLLLHCLLLLVSIAIQQFQFNFFYFHLISEIENELGTHYSTTSIQCIIHVRMRSCSFHSISFVLSHFLLGMSANEEQNALTKMVHSLKTKVEMFSVQRAHDWLVFPVFLFFTR